MFKSPILLTVITCGLFFFFATATSPEEDFFSIELNLTVEVLDTNLVITNNDTLNIANAFLQLGKPTGDSLNGTAVTQLYFANGYNLNIGVSDTFPLSNFTTLDSLTYPVDTFPHSFELDFSFDETVGLFSITF